jgi:hypothetical protein
MAIESEIETIRDSSTAAQRIKELASDLYDEPLELAIAVPLVATYRRPNAKAPIKKNGLGSQHGHNAAA